MPTQDHELRRSLFDLFMGRPPTEEEATFLDAFPTYRGVTGRDIAAWLPVTLTCALWQVFDKGTPAHRVVLLHPGYLKKDLVEEIRSFIRQAAARYHKEGREDRIRALTETLGFLDMSYRSLGENPRWVSLGFLATDPLPSEMQDALWSPT